ncbi:MAG: hypothetical protein SGILL_001765 [Bacillariaceae sp.]
MDYAADWEQRSAWEEGLDVIDSLLQPGSTAVSAMTDRQRSGLARLKSMLLCGDMTNSPENHIPLGLLSHENEANDLLLAAFTGYHRPEDPGRSFKQIIAAHKAAKVLKSKVSTRRLQLMASSDGTYLPPQWLALDKAAQIKLRDLLSWENLSRWDFDVFQVDKATKGKNTLVLVAWAILSSPHAQYAMDLTCNEHEIKANDSKDSPTKGLTPTVSRKGYGFIDQFGIKEEVLIEFLQAIEDRYNVTPYHDKVHASDVTQSLHSILQMGGDKFATNKEQRMELFAVLLAAVVHDVGHPGTNNLYHIHSRSQIAIRYNDQSCLENMHAATAFQIIMGGSPDSAIDIFASFTNDQVTAIRSLMIKVILATDMTKHFVKKNLIKGKLLSKGATADPVTLAKDTSTRHEILGYLLHVADISNPGKPKDTSVKWTDRVLEEFFDQGDKELEQGLPVSPLCDRKTTSRAQSQIGFISFIVLPSYELLGELIPKIDEEVVPLLKSNMTYWEEQKALEAANTEAAPVQKGN